MSVRVEPAPLRPAVARRRARAWPWAVPAVVLLAPFLVWPLAAILWRGIAPDGALTAAVVRDVLTERFFWERLAFTTGQAAASTVLAFLVALPVTYALALVRFRGRSLLRALVTVPFVLPTLVVALAVQQLLGPQGWLNDALDALGLSRVSAVGTLWAILVAHVFYNVAVFVRLVGGVWANVDPRAEEAARMLGAGRWSTFRHVTLPLLLPAVLSAAALVFTFTFTSFGVVLILGGGDPGLATLEVTIFRLASRLASLSDAAILAFVQLGATLVALWLYALLQRRLASTVDVRADRAKPLRATTGAERVVLALAAVIVLLLVIAPIAALVHGAFTLGASGTVTGANFGRLFEDTGRISFIAPLDAIRWSLAFAAGASLLSLVVGVAAGVALARSRGLPGALSDGLLMLPLAVPAVVLGFGYLVTFNRGWYDLRGSPWLVLVAHTLVAYPFVVRAVLAVVRGLDPRLPEAARTLGASAWRAWRHVELPIMSRAMLVGAAFAFAISLGEFGATVLLRRREFATVPIAIFEALGRPGVANLGRALALSVILMALTTLAFLVIERFRYRDVGEF